MKKSKRQRKAAREKQELELNRQQQGVDKAPGEESGSEGKEGRRSSGRRSILAGAEFARKKIPAAFLKQQIPDPWK